MSDSVRWRELVERLSLSETPFRLRTWHFRRECLDHVLVLNEASLCRRVKLFVAYYH
jgi:hypothetical protein